MPVCALAREMRGELGLSIDIWIDPSVLGNLNLALLTRDLLPLQATLLG